MPDTNLGTVTPASTEPHITTATNAATLWKWFQTRGGILIWPNIDLSSVMTSPSSTTPLRTEDGKPYPKPGWRFGNTPRAILDPALVHVTVDREVKRFHVALRQATNTPAWKLTDASVRRLDAALAKAGTGAFFQFDYSTQEAVILAPTSAAVPLPEYINQHYCATCGTTTKQDSVCLNPNHANLHQ